MKTFLIAAVLALNSYLFAGQVSYPVNIPDVSNISIVNGNVAIPIQVPKFRGIDANGNFIDFSKLTNAQFSFFLSLSSPVSISNMSNSPKGEWAREVGVDPKLSFDTILGNDFEGDPELMRFAEESMDPWEQDFYSVGLAKDYTLSKPLNEREIRALSSAQGYRTMYLIFKIIDDTSECTGTGWQFGLDMTLIESMSATITYTYDESLTQILKVKQMWIDLDNMEFYDTPGAIQNVPFNGFDINPNRIVKAEAVYQPHCFYYDGIENLNPIPLACGGYASFVSEMTIDDKYLLTGGLYRGVGSAGQPMNPFDGILDFNGSSGEEDWSPVGTIMDITAPTLKHLDFPANASFVDICGPNHILTYEVLDVDNEYAGWDPVTQTLNYNFAYWSESVIGGKVLITIWYL